MKFKTWLATAVVGLWACGASAATLYHWTVRGNDPFPQPLNGSPSLAKCDMDADGNLNVLCNIWEEGASAGTYTSGAAFGSNLDKFPMSAFSVKYTSETKFDWTFTPGDVVGELLYPTWIAVKAGPRYHVFSVTAGDTSGSGDVGAAVTGRTNAISHVSFYDGAAPIIPLPAGLPMLLGGLGLLAFLRRR